jgi:hypothetical protein
MTGQASGLLLPIDDVMRGGALTLIITSGLQNYQG